VTKGARHLCGSRTTDGATLRGTAGRPVSGVVGPFQPFGPQDSAAGYGARIDWWNGVATEATLTPNAGGGSDVIGTSGAYATSDDSPS
jgi:hypothetical protein